MPAKERLIEVGFDPALGARPLRRAMQHEVEDRLSEQILHGELNAGDHVKVDFEDGEFVFTTAKRDRAGRRRRRRHHRRHHADPGRVVRSPNEGRPTSGWGRPSSFPCLRLSGVLVAGQPRQNA